MTHDEAKKLIEPTGLLAAAHDDIAKVQAILEAQPELIAAMNALTPKDGEETPQRSAAHCRQIAILELFMKMGVMPDLFSACALGLTPAVGAYLKAHPKEVSAKGSHGIALIVHANHAPMVEMLIDCGADPTAALASISWSGRVELMQAAMGKGALVDSPKQGRQPLHIAAAQGHLNAVKILVDAGADLNARAKGAEWEFKTALALARMNNHAPVVALLAALTPKQAKPVRRAGPTRSNFPRR